jgi:hypothetical protein
MLPALLLALAPLDSAGLQVQYSQDVYQAGQILRLTVTGAPGTSGILAFDTVPGPVAIPGLGVLGVGLSPDLVLFPFAPLGPSGSLVLECNVPCESPIVGAPMYTQGLGIAPVTFELCLSNVDVLDVQGFCEGCTPGYWRNHLDAWAVTGYSPDQDFDTVFGVDLFQPDVTLLEAVNGGGGGAAALGRHAVAALLSAGHPGVDYPLSQADVLFLVDCAFQLGTIEETKNDLAAINESGCPL